jgi:negative regulator of flagellin synthesis FlgM
VKIDNSLNALLGGVKGGNSRPEAAKGGGEAARSAAVPRDNVQLSAPTASGNAAPMDSARVDAIKQAISEGRFKINPEAIADGLIASAKELVMEQRA